MNAESLKATWITSASPQERVKHLLASAPDFNCDIEAAFKWVSALSLDEPHGMTYVTALSLIHMQAKAASGTPPPPTTPPLAVRPTGTPPYTYVCTACGSDNVQSDAWATWDVAAQDWVLSQTFDECFCETCESACSIQQRAIEAAPAT